MLFFRKWLVKHHPDKTQGKTEEEKSTDMVIIKEYGKIFLADCYDDRVSTNTFCFEDFFNKEKGLVFIKPSSLSHRTSVVASVNHVCFILFFLLLLLFACLFVFFIVIYTAWNSKNSIFSVCKIHL